MTTFALQADHLSGRFDRAPALLRDQVAASLAAGSTIVTLTEVDRRPRAKALRSIEGTRTLRAPGTTGETAILLDRATWKVVRWGARWVTGPVGPRRGVMLTWAIVRHRATGATGLVSVVHYPSGVEGSWRTRARAVLAHRSAVAKVRAVHRRKRRRRRRNGRPLDFELHMADWNLNLHRAWVRAWVRSVWPALKAVPKVVTPSRGTHGKRLIDWPVSRRVVLRRLVVLPGHPASDHRGVRLTGKVRKSKG